MNRMEGEQGIKEEALGLDAGKRNGAESKEDLRRIEGSIMGVKCFARGKERKEKESAKI